MRAFYILFYLILAVLLGAVGDGLNNTGVQTWGHVFEGLEIAAIFFALYVLDEDKSLKLFEVLLIFGSYICMRVVFFDYAYNLTASNKLTYLSDKNFWGKLWLEWLKAPPEGIIWMRLFFLIIGVSFPFKYLR
jgi:hypothetical protein